MTTETTAVCQGCKESKPETEFYFRDAARTRRQSYCKTCKSQYNRTWYERNRTKHQADVARFKKVRKAELAELIRAAKDVPCADCGERYPPWVMDFDHVRGVKRGVVSYLASRTPPVATILDEIAKCEVVCANCHRARTFSRIVHQQA